MVIRRVLAAAAAAAAIGLAVGLGAIALSADHPSGFRAAVGYWTRARLLRSRPLRAAQYVRAPSPGQSRVAHPAVLAPRVGALFIHEGSTDHFCTASVVASPGRDLLVTAAHCIYGDGRYRQDVAFVPDYRDGDAPFGIWSVKKLVVAEQWMKDSDPDFDIGFVMVGSHDGRDIEDVLGSNRLAVDTGYQYEVRVTGYPDGSSDPQTCLDWTSQESATQLQFGCDGFTGGTSGSPWITDFNPATRSGMIVGVLGGYQQGGDTSAISYSPFLGRAIQDVYQQAIAAERAPAKLTEVRSEG